MEDKLLNYLKIQVMLKKLTREQVISKYPQYEGKI